MHFLNSYLSLIVLFVFCSFATDDLAFGANKPCVGSKLVNIVIIADAFEEENALRNFELKETMQKRSGEWRFSRVRNEEDIQKALHVNQGECINTMIVSGLHTSWENGKLKASVRYGEGGHLVYRPIDFDHAFRSNSNFPVIDPFSFTLPSGTKSVDQSQSNISKFAKGALVAFNSCHLAPKENPNMIFRRISSVLDLSKGSIYANYTYGVAHPSNILAVPCYTGSQGGLVKSLRTVLQAVWPLTLSISSAAYSLENKGYLASIDGEKITYSPSRFQDAIKKPDK